MIGENSYLWYILCLKEKMFSVPQLPVLQVFETGIWRPTGKKLFDKPQCPSKTMMQLTTGGVQNLGSSTCRYRNFKNTFLLLEQIRVNIYPHCQAIWELKYTQKVNNHVLFSIKVQIKPSAKSHLSLLFLVIKWHKRLAAPPPLMPQTTITVSLLQVGKYFVQLKISLIQR